MFGAAAGMMVAIVGLAQAGEVSFSRDVLPVLSDRCFHCHGPDESHREADLRLDVEASAKQDLGGYAAITEGQLDKSELWRRIATDDPDERMPPVDSHRKVLTPSERAAIRQWILSGAKWGKHWAFEKLIRPALRAEGHPIDVFVRAKLAEAGLAPSPRAPQHTQLRRLSLDLTGITPTPGEIEALDAGSDDAWNEAIDRLLASPRYAERMAMWWLDAARYSDSDGFQQDATRQNWPWRDWVIRQFQKNQSFRDFTIEQFAGDLLPEATDEQILATCFHRNHMTNGEGGRDPEESRIDYVIDRVNTTGTVWLGLTLGCAQCHSHKFDPVSHRDYYAMSAFFNSIDEDGKAGMNAKPYLSYRSQAVASRIVESETFLRQIRQEVSEERKLAEQRFQIWLKDIQHQPAESYKAWWSSTPGVRSVEGTEFRVEHDGVIQTQGPSPVQDDYRVAITVPAGIQRVTGIRLEVFSDPSHVDQRFTRAGNGDFTLTSVLAAVRRQSSPAEQPLDIVKAVADYEAEQNRKTSWDKRYGPISKTLNDDARDGWTTEGAELSEAHVGVFAMSEPYSVRTGDQLVVTLRHRSTHGNANIGRFRLSFCSELGETVTRVDGASPIADLLKATDPGLQTPSQPALLENALRQRLVAQYLLGDEDYASAAAKLKFAQKQHKQLIEDEKPRKVMVLKDRSEPRETHVLLRGVWDAKGDGVEPGVLTDVLAWPQEETQNRLDLAEWIVDSDNPLTPRVVVNHLWQIMFGQGLVRTPEDFGLQGQLPTHPELLDWLAVELIEHDWDLQHILRLIATSDTYRQSSVATDELREKDPTNRLLARASRYRMAAWMIRDNALSVAGLLNDAVGGPPVRPYQPIGVWSEITMGRFRYEPSLGPAQYRRTIYAFWRRSSAPAFLFDSAQRRVCEVGVRRTNTPLQALTLMNDTTMLEASRVLANEAVLASAAWTDQAAQRLAVRVLSRRLVESELRELRRVWSSAETYFARHHDDAVEFCSVGQQLAPSRAQAPQLAAWMTSASLLLNLDEAMTRE